MLFRYAEWKDQASGASPFEQLFELFRQLLEYTAGDAAEALRWLTILDERHGLSTGEMGIGDFIEELRKRGFIEDSGAPGQVAMTPRMERTLRSRSLEEMFRQLRKGTHGQHATPYSGQGGERLSETREWRFGDEVSRLDITGTLSSAFRRNGLEAWNLLQEDLQVHETDHHTSTATVLMIDLSHSMVLYGEDRITPARRTAMALAELIMTRYPKDSLDIVAFGNDAWEVSVKDLPYLQVGPYHTNTRAGLERARDILRRRRNRNRQIFMITDGKPSCHYEYGRMYRNAYGLDRRIVARVLDEAVRCRRERITITTFMIARDPYLQRFVRELTEANRGRAYFASLDDLGSFLFEDFMRNRRRTVR
jgi:uncharacterized protein with von Willebrand factor type A (vWA) domain